MAEKCQSGEREKGEGRREKGEGRREKGEGRREAIRKNVRIGHRWVRTRTVYRIGSACWIGTTD
jgi:hypothetical protein